MKPGPTYYPISTDLKVHIVINAILVLTATVLVAARIVSRVVTGVRLGWDDGFVLVALPLGIGLLVIEGILATVGLGYRKATYDNPNNLWTVLPLNTAFTLCYIPLIAAVKCSMLFFYRRAFSETKARLTIYITLGFVVSWFVTHLLTSLLSCQPIAVLVDPSVPGFCNNSTIIVIALAAINVGTDIAIMLIPIPTILGLKIKLSEKIGVLGLVFLGILVTVASIVRLYYYTHVQELADWTGSMPPVIFVSIFEGNLGIIITSLPMIRPLWTALKKRRDANRRDSWGGDEGKAYLFRNSVQEAHEFEIIEMRLDVGSIGGRQSNGARMREGNMI
ncbi:uncharacterized protein JN550_006403 [Neoarthrinium moseri]|uniref:uncharacterized protein n=1 Tax=Neoarthrinium moseri TaxID=1658444 RepID=UPI001FDDC604|nr:uncharacterized protein JN550_006403 [Neoarthrinium moseri]KAI1868487.1 hypothetical protein JN550_006403 [Neoarthrinium moseri]